MQTNHDALDHYADDTVILMTSPEQAEKVIDAHDVLMLYFTAPGCSVCHAVRPRVIELAERYKIPVLLASIDEQIAFSAQRLVFTVPTVLILHLGHEIGRESRFINFEQLERTLSFAAI